MHAQRQCEIESSIGRRIAAGSNGRSLVVELMPAELRDELAWQSKPQAGLGVVNSSARWTILTDDTNRAVIPRCQRGACRGVTEAHLSTLGAPAVLDCSSCRRSDGLQRRTAAIPEQKIHRTRSRDTNTELALNWYILAVMYGLYRGGISEGDLQLYQG